MSEADATTDRRRLAAARRVITGEEHQGEGNAVYVVYVAVIIAGAYGVPASQQLFRFLDPQWMADHLSGGRGLVAGLVLVVALLALAVRAGAVRGPVVPELPYLDHVASSPLDRYVVLRRWWRLGLTGGLVGGLLTGLVVGAGLAIAQVTGPVVLLPAVALGLVIGLLVTGAWLHGQVHAALTADRGRGGGVHPLAGLDVFLRGGPALRGLRLPALRAQSARSVTIGGGVLAGDLRAVRLEVASPTTRARRTRLRAHGPVLTLVLRDVLGLRRAPGALVTGVVLSGTAAYGLAHAATPGVPSVVALAALLVGYLGIGQWCEGLRMQGDNAGTPPLIGLSARTEALAHLVAPTALYAVTALAVGAAASVSGGVAALGVAWAVVMVAPLLGGQLMAAFRGLPPAAVFAPGRGIGTTALWYSVPLLSPAVVGTAVTAMLTSSALRTQAPVALVLGGYLLLTWGLRRVRTLTDAHRS
ncbi:hypothetical protein V3N99_13130 [Dermatophilaceae bacterium Soc4.6]